MLKTMFLLIALAAVPSKPSAITRVKAYAVSQHEKITITNRSGYIWIEMNDSDIFGVGRSVDAAAQDFLEDLDIVEHETSPQNIIQGQIPSPWVCPPKADCI